jgi:hypothetical protein
MKIEHSPAVLINQTFARELFPGENAIGKRFRYCDQASEPREIVGIVEEGKYRALSETPMPAVFSPLTQFPGLTGTIVARSSLPEGEVAGMIRRAALDVEPALVLFDVGSLSEQLGLAILPAGVAATAMGAFGLLAIVLAATGVYGVLAYAVSRRTREIGIRVSLASSAIVLRLILGRTAARLPLAPHRAGFYDRRGGFLASWTESAPGTVAFLLALLMALVGQSRFCSRSF